MKRFRTMLQTIPAQVLVLQNMVLMSLSIPCIFNDHKPQALVKIIRHLSQFDILIVPVTTEIFEGRKPWMQKCLTFPPTKI